MYVKVAYDNSKINEDYDDDDDLRVALQGRRKEKDGKKEREGTAVSGIFDFESWQPYFCCYHADGE